MNSKEALETIGMTKTNNIKSESLSKPRVMYLVKELRKKEIQTIKKDLEVLEWLKKSIISKKRIQSLRETANPIYEIILHIPQNILKEVLGND